MERLLQDTRFALRLLWKDRGFTITSVLTLALCIGANGSIFAIVNSVLLRPLPVPEPDRLVIMYNSYPGAGVERGSSGVPDYYDRLRDTDVFEEIALYQMGGRTIGGGTSDPERVMTMAARPSLFRLLRAQPAHGRLFSEDEGEIGREKIAVLSDAFAKQMFGSPQAAVGRELRVSGEPVQVVGVMPPAFHFMDPEVRLWMPLAFTPQQKSDDARHSNSWTMVARLKPGASIQVAQQQVDAVNARNLERFPAFKQVLLDVKFHTVVEGLQANLVKEARPVLLLLWGGVLFVLAIGAVNITNLALVRATARMRELATRHALGAGLSRIVRQLLTESVLLTLAGGAAGVGVGYLGLRVLAGFGLEALPRASEVRMDGVAILFTLALAFAVGIVVGLVPMISLRNMNLSQAFREEGRSGTSGRGGRAARRVLVTAQVAFAFMLLAGAGLLLASFERVLAVRPGFDPANVLTARIAAPASRYPGQAPVVQFTERLLARVRSLPGVVQAGTTSNIPFGGDFSDGVIMAEGYRPAPGESVISPYRISVSPGYMEALGMTVLRGRAFRDSDTADAPRVTIIDERLARRYWPGQDAIGKRMFLPEGPNDLVSPPANPKWITVVGVVAETKNAGLVSTDDRLGAYYFPMSQQVARNMTLAIKTQGEPTAIVNAVRQELRGIDPELPLYSVRTLEDRMSESLADRRTPMVLALLFAVVALFLAAVGIYGVLAYQVTQRRKEIGIRIALGSDGRSIFTLVVREGTALVATGFVVGLAGAYAIRRAIEGQLYGVGAMDPRVLTVVTVLLAIVALTACAIPARRATRIDPVIALNEQ